MGQYHMGSESRILSYPDRAPVVLYINNERILYPLLRHCRRNLLFTELSSLRHSARPLSALHPFG